VDASVERGDERGREREHLILEVVPTRRHTGEIDDRNAHVDTAAGIQKSVENFSY
jgi:hypothetical protein